MVLWWFLRCLLRLANAVAPVAVPGVALPPIPLVPPVAANAVAPVAVTVAGHGVTPPPVLPAVAPPPCVELLKLDLLKDAKAFLNSLEQIQFYLCMPIFLQATQMSL